VSNLGVVLDEVSVEVAEVEEGLEFLGSLGNGPFLYCWRLWQGSFLMQPSDKMMPRYLMVLRFGQAWGRVPRPG
jgi:hypothetical protein